MSNYEIELSEPTASTCDCCGGTTVRLTRFVSRGGDAVAVYYAAYSNNHPDNLLSMLVSVGDWGDGSEPAQRAAFFCRVRPTDDSYEVMLGDAAKSFWSDAELLGEKLSPEAARRHPWKATAFEVLDEAFAQDPSLQGFLLRVQCGDSAVPLEHSFQMPDDVFGLDDDEQAKRAEIKNDFVVLDGKRFFVRCLLPIPVESYGAWCVGLWVEVSKADYSQVSEAWNDSIRYPKLRFSGVIANDTTALALPISSGMTVQVHVPDGDEPPKIAALANDELAKLLSATWSKAAFEEYALARGFL